MGVLDRLLRVGDGRTARSLDGFVQRVNGHAGHYRQLSDRDLGGEPARLRAIATAGALSDDDVAAAFAVVREAADRLLGLRPYDVQVFGAGALVRGMVAEMATGEGKTLAATMPVFVHALSGEGVHVTTVNEYLAGRDAAWMGALYRFLGLTVAVNRERLTVAEKRRAYQADVTYGTVHEFGFDYLRDNMAQQTGGQVQRGHAYALVDEADSVLIDQARTPLLIAGADSDSGELYDTFALRVVPNLVRGTAAKRGGPTGDYLVDTVREEFVLTEAGIAKVESIVGVDNLYDIGNSALVTHLLHAIRAREFHHRNDDYVVRDGQIVLVDRNTGRPLDGTRYADGLHQAIEAKEGLVVSSEEFTAAKVTVQNYYRIYRQLAGMTGTAVSDAQEFLSIYKLPVVRVPTHRPVIREDDDDIVVATTAEKFKVVADEVAERHERQQPVLVGTQSVGASEQLSALLTRRGIDHQVLNAKRDGEREAAVVAQAGAPGAVTVATNMAGRGTDIVLGGNPHFFAARQVATETGPDVSAEERDAQIGRWVADHADRFADAASTVVAAGGLHVIGTEHHDTERIDNQLRGRAGRQGDPGSTQFIVSFEDALIRRYHAGRNLPDVNSSAAQKVFTAAQQRAENLQFTERKELLKYDDVLNEQRTVLYTRRQELLSATDDGIAEHTRRNLSRFFDTVFDRCCPAGTYPEEWDLHGLRNDLHSMYPTGFAPDAVDPFTVDRNTLKRALADEMLSAYHDAAAAFAAPRQVRKIERFVLLSELDSAWETHLQEIDTLLEGVNLRSYSERDPLVEFRRDAHESFDAISQTLPELVAEKLFAALAGKPPAGALALTPATAAQTALNSPDHGSSSAGSSSGKVGRNEPCPCGSGTKWKRCHGDPTRR